LVYVGVFPKRPVVFNSFVGGDIDEPNKPVVDVLSFGTDKLVLDPNNPVDGFCSFEILYLTPPKRLSDASLGLMPKFKP
jgi:hypothetical protein